MVVGVVVLAGAVAVRVWDPGPDRSATAAPEPATVNLPSTAGAAQVGPSYYATWANGPSSDPAVFPIGVWLQDPRRTLGDVDNAANYRAIGVNMFVGLWQWPPDAGQLSMLKAAGLTAIAGGHAGSRDEIEAARDHPDASTTLDGYLLYDEPDMNQADGSPSGAGCIAPATVQKAAARARQLDPSRPIYINFGKGMALPDYNGGRNCDNSPGALAEYARACDVCSVDYYALSDPYEPPSNKGIWAYGRSIDRLRAAVGDAKPVWGFVETTLIDRLSKVKAKPDQVRSMVWMSIIHGARGIQYFAHSFNPELREDALLQDRAMAAGLTLVNAELQRLALVLNAPDERGTVSVSTPKRSVPVDMSVKSVDGDRYVLAIGSGTAAEPEGGSTTARFEVQGGGDGRVDVLGEGRVLVMTAGAFTDSFSPYEVHLYRIAGAGK